MTPSEAIEIVKLEVKFWRHAFGENLKDIGEAQQMVLDEITRLRSLIDQTADGVLVPDCEKMYCPSCGGVVIRRFMTCEGSCYDPNCVRSQYTFTLTECYSSHEAWEKATWKSKNTI